MSIIRQFQQETEMAAMEFHPLADLFPMMRDEEITALAADIKEHGLRDPIVTLDGKILDGRNRYRACDESGVKPIFEKWNGEGTAQAFVVSHNLHRRHLNESQRGMVAAKLANLRDGQRADYAQKSAGAQISAPALSNADAAKLLNVGKRTVQAAKKVLAHGTSEEIAAVEQGIVSASTIENRMKKNVPAGQRLGKTPNAEAARTETKRAHGKLWTTFKDALLNLTSLPLPADVARIVRYQDRQKITDTKLLPAIQWLKEFENAWTSPDAAENPGGKDKSARKAKEDTDAREAEAGSPGEGERIGGRRQDHTHTGSGSLAA